jgi:IS605 OrfB family transposase
MFALFVSSRVVGGASPVAWTMALPRSGCPQLVGSPLTDRTHESNISSPCLSALPAWCTAPPTFACASPVGRPAAATGCCGRPETCGRGCWTPTGSATSRASSRSPATRRSAASSPAPDRSGSCRWWGHGRCSSATATPGARPPNAAASTRTPASHGASAPWSRSAVTTEPSRSRANGCDCRSPRATRRYGCGWLARCRIRPSRSARRVRRAEARHRRRVHQAQHQAAKQVIAFAVQQRIGTLVVGDPKGITNRDVGRVQNLRLRRWRRTHLLQALSDKAEQAGMVVRLVDERGTSSTCPACQRRVPKPKGRDFGCPDCGFQGHRDLVGPAWPRATHQPLTGTVGVARHMQVCILGVARIKQRRPTGQTLPEGALVPPFGLLEPGLEGPSGAGDPDQQPLQVRQRPLARLGPGKPGRDPLVHTTQPSTSGMSSQARKSTSRSLRRSGAWTGTQWLTPSSRW